MSLGSRLRSFITLNGLSVRELEKRTGIPYRSLHEYLSDKRKPGADHLAKMPTVGIDVEWLLTGEVKPGLKFKITADRDDAVTLDFDLSNIGGLSPATGSMCADLTLSKMIVRDSIELVNEVIEQNPTAFSLMGVQGCVTSVWVVFSAYMSSIERHEEHFVTARDTDYPVEKIAEILFGPVREKLKSSLLDRANDLAQSRRLSANNILEE